MPEKRPLPQGGDGGFVANPAGRARPTQRRGSEGAAWAWSIAFLPVTGSLAMKKRDGRLELCILFLFLRHIRDAATRFLRFGIFQMPPQLGFGLEGKQRELHLQVGGISGSTT